MPSSTAATILTRRNGRVTVPGTTVALLTTTSKMPSKSWSLPAGDACPAAVFGAGAICGSCYAAKGAYAWSTTKRAQRERFNWTVRSMRTPEGREEFIATMVAAIGTRNPYFRVHDSGDLFSPAYTSAWAEIARRLPTVQFWVPTRTYRFLAMPKWAAALAELSALPNVTIRPSALHFDAPAPEVPSMAAGTTASKAGFTCPAHSQGNQCGSCRACWDAPSMPISYRKH